MQRSNLAFSISLLIFSFFFILLSNLFFKIIPLTYHHTVYYCKEALNTLSIALPDSTPLLFSGAILIIILSGITIFIIQILRTSFYLRKILKTKIKILNNTNFVANQLKMVNKIDMVNNPKISSFCYGLFSPRICISSQLANSLTTKELTAVLAHELNHVKNRDPLRILLSQVITTMFFFLPVFRDLHNYFALCKEIEADKFAIKTLGNSLHLKKALGKILTPFTINFIPVAAFAEKTNIETRILSIKGIKTNFNISYSRIVLSVIMILLTLVVLKTPVYSVGNENSHEYFVSPYGNQCISPLSEKTVTHDLFSSSTQNYHSVNHPVNR